MSKINTLATAVQEKGVLVAAHRGVASGNIPCNTLAAFEAALRQGADILETDVILSDEGEMYIFHTKQEPNHLNKAIRLERLGREEVLSQRFVNVDNDETPYGVVTLDSFLETFKNRGLINLDHAWDFIPEVTAAIRRHGMEDQILMKTPAKLKFFQTMEQVAPDVMFMPVLKEVDEFTPLLETMDLNFVAAEVVFAREDSLMCSEEYIESHHRKGRKLWVNPLLYSYKAQLTAGHNDDIAVTSDPEYGWGWLVDKGYDILQTDWPLQLRLFLNNR